MKNANLVCRSVLVGALSLVALSFDACRQHEASKPKSAEYKTPSDVFPIKVGDHTVQMQVAALMPEMMRGLMGRKDLGENQGMIFVYQKPERMSFFMKNTRRPSTSVFSNRTERCTRCARCTRSTRLR